MIVYSIAPCGSMMTLSVKSDSNDVRDLAFKIASEYNGIKLSGL